MALRPARRCCWRARAKRPKSELLPRWLRSRFCAISTARSSTLAMAASAAACPAAGPAAAPPPAIAASPVACARSLVWPADAGHPLGRLRPRDDPPRVEDAAGAVHGRGHGLPVGRELLQELETVPHVEDREQEVRPVLRPQQLERGVPGEGAPLLAQGVEDEGDERRVAGRLGRGRRRGRAGRGGGAPGAAEGGEGARSTKRKPMIALGLPSSKTSISSGRRSLTVRPFLSRATTSSTTAWVPDGKTGAASGFGGCCGAAASVAADRRAARSIVTSSAGRGAATWRRPGSASPRGRRPRTSRAGRWPRPCRSC